MNFIYTSRPDVCLIQNHGLKRVRDQLEEGLKQDLISLSVCFDPEVDTPEMVKQYAIQQGFDVPGWQFLTGPQEQIHQVTDDYGVQYELVEANKEDEGSHEHEHVRGFNHSIVVVLIARDGMVRKTYGSALFPETEMISDITSLLKNKGGKK